MRRHLLLLALAVLGIVIAASPAVAQGGATAAMADRARSLRVAADRGDVAAVRDALDAGVPVDFADEYGLTPLMAAAFSGRVDVVRLLLARNADPRLSHRSGETAMSYAASNGHREVTRVLAETTGSADPLASRATPRPPVPAAAAPAAPAAPARPGPVAPRAPAAPAAADGLAGRGGPLATGVYTCRDAGSGGEVRPEEYGSFRVGGFTTTRFEITGPTAYVYRGTRRIPGGLAYDPGSGAVRFTSGPLAGSAPGAITGHYGRRPDGKPALTLTYRFADGTSAREFCAPISQ